MCSAGSFSRAIWHDVEYWIAVLFHVDWTIPCQTMWHQGVWTFTMYLYFQGPKPLLSLLSRDSLTRNYAVTALSADIKLPIKKKVLCFKCMSSLMEAIMVNKSIRNSLELACTQHFTPKRLLSFLKNGNSCWSPPAGTVVLGQLSFYHSKPHSATGFPSSTQQSNASPWIRSISEEYECES